MFQIDPDVTTEDEFMCCTYCGEPVDLTAAPMFNTDTGARFDRDELGLDPEEDQD